MPVHMAVTGDELRLTVPHRNREVAYPLLVDPEVAIENPTEASGWTSEDESTSRVSIEKSFTPGGPLHLSLAGVIGGLNEIGWEGHPHADYRWIVPTSEEGEVSGVEFIGVSGGAAASDYGRYRSNYSVEASVKACEYVGPYAWVENPATDLNNLTPDFRDYAHGSYYCSGAPITVEVAASVSGGGGLTEEEEKKYGKEESGVSLEASISIGAIVLYQRATGAEERQQQEEELFGEANPDSPEESHCMLGEPVNCATGNQVETQTDLSVGGRGPALKVLRTYNSQLAAKATSPGMFGYGWTDSYGAHITHGTIGCHHEDLETKKPITCDNLTTVYQGNGSIVRFVELHGSKSWSPINVAAQATLTEEAGKTIYTLPNQTKLGFNSSGQLASETDRNGNALTMSYNVKGQLEAVSDAAGRKIMFVYNSEGSVESATDPMGHLVKYTYESGNLASVTAAGESKLQWKFKYNTLHELTTKMDGREHSATTEYYEEEPRRVKSQTDALGGKREWKYTTLTSGIETTITEPNGSTTVEKFNEAGRPTSVTHASGTSIAVTTTYEYNSVNELTAVTDPNKHTTTYRYDADADRISETTPLGNKTEWEYDSTHDVIGITLPDGEKTTIKRNSAGDVESISKTSAARNGTDNQIRGRFAR